MVVYRKLSLKGKGRLQEVIAYRKWSLTVSGRLRKVVAFRKWSLTGSGRLQEVVALERSDHRGTKIESHGPVVISMYKTPTCQCKILYHIEVLMQRTESGSFYWSCTVTLFNLSLFDIEISASDRLPEIKNNRKTQITSVKSGRGRFREASTIVI